MATMYPPEIVNAHGEVSEAEKTVFAALEARLAEDYEVIWSFKYQDDRGVDAEADFVICHPSRPHYIVLEVKGNEVRFSDNKWQQRTRQGRWSTIDPVNQARRAMYTIRDIASRKNAKVSFDFALVFPDVSAPARSWDNAGGVSREQIWCSQEVGAIDPAVDSLFRQRKRSAGSRDDRNTLIQEVLRPGSGGGHLSRKRLTAGT